MVNIQRPRPQSIDQANIATRFDAFLKIETSPHTDMKGLVKLQCNFHSLKTQLSCLLRLRLLTFEISYVFNERNIA